MRGAVCVAVLCIRETGDPHVILTSFPCGKKSRPLYCSSQGLRLLTCSVGRAAAQDYPKFLLFSHKEFEFLQTSIKLLGGFFLIISIIPPKKDLMREQMIQSPDRPANRTQIKVKLYG